MSPMRVSEFAISVNIAAFREGTSRDGMSMYRSRTTLNIRGAIFDCRSVRQLTLLTHKVNTFEPVPEALAFARDLVVKAPECIGRWLAEEASDPSSVINILFPRIRRSRRREGTSKARVVVDLAVNGSPNGVLMLQV